MLLPQKMCAQFNAPDKVNTHKDSLIGNQIDVVDIWHDIWHIKSVASSDSAKLKKGKIYLSVIPAIGYTIQTSFTATGTANISFYTDDPRTTNISTVFVNGNYSLLRQITIPVETDIWSKNNNFDLIGDYRYYKYPSVTYGLGGQTTIADADHLDYSYVRFYQSVAKEIFPNFLTGIGYNLDYHYDIQDFGNSEGTQTDLRKYDGGVVVPTTISSGLSLNMLYDTRRNSNNPQGGWFGNVIIRPNLTLLGSTNSWQLLYAEFRRYIRFPGNSHNILSFWNFYWFTLGHAPYLDLPATAWDTYENSGRGYTQDRFKGPGMMYFETEYRFRILTNGLLGGVVFANAESVSNWPSNTFNSIYPAIGTGFRIKINKFSNTNFCLDYAWGLNGSGGFFLNLGEVF